MISSGPTPGDLDRISEVLPYLCVGSYGAAENADHLRERGITHVICLLEECPEAVDQLPKLCIPMSDYGDSDLRQWVADAIPFIERAQEAGGRVLVFCALGVNRSPALVAGYLKVKLRYSTAEALKVLTSIRPFVSVHQRYLEQLERLTFGGSGGYG